MSKKKRKIEEEILQESVEEPTLSKKELYDLNKKKKEEEKIKNIKKTKNKKLAKKKKPVNHLARAFAIFMLLLMTCSVIVSAATYIR